jgi:DNA-binding LacI/PurR family transcriptional regulator
MSDSRPTIHDVARLSGRSKSLVSLALSGSPKVSNESKTRILKAAEELGYRPNQAARSLAVRRSKTLGVLILDLHNPVFAEILDGVQKEVREHGFSTMLVTGGDDPVFEQSEIETLLQFQIEGLILISHRLSDASLRKITSEVPTVILTRDDISLPGVDTVSNDDIAGAALGVDHLVQLGHSEIIYLSGGDNPVSHSRVTGYLQAMKRHKIAKSSRVIAGGLTNAAGYAAAVKALEFNPTAVFAANDIAAMGAIAAIADRGLRIPEDVSVIGYDGISLGGLRNINLTTISQPLADIGRLAANRLVERINNPKLRSKKTQVSAELVVRGTTQKNSRSKKN